jgi:hypothetical protein
MSDSDKMRQEFEAWAEDNDCGITLAATTATGFYTRNIAWTAWQSAYAAGRKAEREQFESLLPYAVREGLKIVAEGER